MGREGVRLPDEQFQRSLEEEIDWVGIAGESAPTLRVLGSQLHPSLGSIGSTANYHIWNYLSPGEAEVTQHSGHRGASTTGGAQ